MRVSGHDAGRPESPDPIGESPADIAKADDADRMTGNASHRLQIMHGEVPVSTPGSLSGGADGIGQAACKGQQHGHGVVGNLGGIHARDVARQNTQLGSSSEIDRVDADTHAANHLEIRACL